MKIAALFAFLSITFVPLDDRPVNYQLPQLLGRIAGVSIQAPPKEILGRYLSPGKPDQIISWLNSGSRRKANNYVIASDMLAYGGLVASRIPGISYADAEFRLRELAHLHQINPRADIGVFGTVMRLAPTGVPAIGEGTNFFAAYPVWKYLQQYANLHDPPLPAEEATAAHLVTMIGPATLQAYLETRARNLAIDRRIVALLADGTIARAALGQDDAGPVGLHIKEVAALQDDVRAANVTDRMSLEPGADELGMAMVARAMAQQIHWTPHVAVHYSTPSGALYNDPLEFAPIGTAIDGLVRLCGGVKDDQRPDITLFVRVPHSSAANDAQLLGDIQAAVAEHHPALIADLTFLENSFVSQAAFAKTLLESGVASRLDAYSSWNTNANTVGTALAEGIAAAVGRRAHRYDALAHAEFTFNRFVDDYAFHDFVRPDLNTWLDQQGTSDHTYLLKSVASAAGDRNTSLLWNRAEALLHDLYPQYHIAAIRVSLPWDRTFETQLDVALAPGLPR